MAAPIHKKLSATTSEQTHAFGNGIRSIHVRNDGAGNVQLAFDRDIDADSYLLDSGESISIETPVITLHYKGDATATLYVIALRQ